MFDKGRRISGTGFWFAVGVQNAKKNGIKDLFE
jgi:hypothetical protein